MSCFLNNSTNTFTKPLAFIFKPRVNRMMLDLGHIFGSLVKIKRHQNQVLLFTVQVSFTTTRQKNARIRARAHTHVGK